MNERLLREPTTKYGRVGRSYSADKVDDRRRRAITALSECHIYYGATYNNSCYVGPEGGIRNVGGTTGELESNLSSLLFLLNRNGIFLFLGLFFHKIN